MKTLIVSFLLGASFPVYAYESIGYRSYRQSYDSQQGYAYENRCFRYEYREKYIPGNLMSPGYVTSFNEKVSIPCNIHGKVFNHNLCHGCCME